VATYGYVHLTAIFINIYKHIYIIRVNECNKLWSFVLCLFHQNIITFCLSHVEITLCLRPVQQNPYYNQPLRFVTLKLMPPHRVEGCVSKRNIVQVNINIIYANSCLISVHLLAYYVNVNPKCAPINFDHSCISELETFRKVIFNLFVTIWRKETHHII